ncbi:hypothetical protein FGO68_gene3441 [Halteria grandinella]|uniref:Helicase ATP-binding domain-containing protein n=1 Tax=Halteria grandinella TaxID=5974 RepID=A0A8J8N9I6_HALGN|nr:hypothetical protein FGO68_gene3441 [Halteria grandinella]
MDPHELIEREVIQEDIYENLFKHQITGILWLYENYMLQKGCILADDMGLGKTVQISAFLGSLYLGKKFNQAVICAPATLMEYWRSEIKRWTPGLLLHVIVLDQALKKRQEIIQQNKYTKNLVYITTPNTIFKHVDDFAQFAALDLLVVDEGHKAKNVNTRIRKGIKDLYVKRQKIILTGTPVQNNLIEFFSLMDIVEDGILGTQSEFQSNYRNVIENGLKKRALYKNIMRAKEAIAKLKGIFTPHFLRRTKREIFDVKSSELSEQPLDRHQLPLKTDLVVWIPLNEIQKTIYEMILDEQSVEAAVRQQSKKHIFVVIIALKHLCVHPFILLHSFCKSSLPFVIKVLSQQ